MVLVLFEDLMRKLLHHQSEPMCPVADHLMFNVRHALQCCYKNTKTSMDIETDKKVLLIVHYCCSYCN